FAHTKLLLVDDIYVCLGSTNLDPRSLSLNFELNVEVFSPELNARLHEFAASVLAVSHEVTLENLLSRPLAVRLRNAAAWIFSPYL
ncbi:MAG: cardiolipin synthase, partial [Desulfovibrionaceae bacterium]|nr:cardiolipin synthase [Desulfovibrionaceae bacterium]